MLDDISLCLLQFELLGDVRSDHNARLSTTSAGNFIWLQRVIFPANWQKIRKHELATRLASVLGRWWLRQGRRRIVQWLHFQRPRLEEQLLIGAGHVTFATRPKECLLEERQLLASPIEGDLLRRKLFLLDGDQRLLLSDYRILLGDKCCQFLSAAFQSVEPQQEFVGGTSVIHA